MDTLHLLYHRVNEWKPDPWTLCVSPAHFAEQMQVVCKLNPRPVITFDDGYADNLYSALPILERYDVSARFFIVSGALGSQMEMWWDALEQLFFLPGLELPVAEQAYMEAFRNMRSLFPEAQQAELARYFSTRQLTPSLRPGRRMMTGAELASLADSPLAEIGAHTVSHPVLSFLSAGRQEDEIKSSKIKLEDIIGSRVDGFAYPNGMPSDYTDNTIKLVERCGFAYAYSAFEHDRQDRFQIPRVMIRNWNGEEFSRHLATRLASKNTGTAVAEQKLLSS